MTTAQHIESNANQILEDMITRFTSSNSIPVERSTIKRDEFEQLLQYIALLKSEVEHCHAA